MIALAQFIDHTEHARLVACRNDGYVAVDVILQLKELLSRLVHISRKRRRQLSRYLLLNRNARR